MSTSTTTYTGYDALRRVTRTSQTTQGQTYPFTYTYNRAGAFASETYPSGRTITTAYDGANRPTTVTGTVNGVAKTYVDNVAYAPHEGLTAYRFGNNLWRQTSYNSRLQTQQSIDLVNNDFGQQLLVGQYDWGLGNDNGNLKGVTWNHGGPNYPQFLTLSESFGYDNLNRLSSATDTGWSQTFGYDAFGNMWVTGATGLPANNGRPTAGAYGANNRFVAGNYDAAGNLLSLTNVPGSQSYDGENRITQVSGSGTTTYAYDSDGRRVVKISGSITTVYVYDAQGTLTAEYSSGAATAPLCSTCYLSADHLGSTRMVTDASAKAISRHDYTPFGEEITGGTAGRRSEWGLSDSINQKFTGKERDSEFGFDYFGARYYGSALGRFTSPDPAKLDIRHLLNPQKWNKYAYTINNPLRYFDPDGQEEVDIQLRAYIPQASVGPYRGDNRGPTTSQSVTSRTSISVRVETDPAKAQNPLIGTPVSRAGQTENLLTGAKATQTQGLPTAQVSRDSNGT